MNNDKPSEPETPQQVAAALRVIAAQLDALPDTAPIRVGLRIQPRVVPSPARVKVVDAVSVALFGIPARPLHMHGEVWHQTTIISSDHIHPTGLDVDVFGLIDPPTVDVSRTAEVEPAKDDPAGVLVAAAILTPDSPDLPDEERS